MKKPQNLRASRRAVSGCIASALIRSMPSCMPSDSLRAGNRPAAVAVDRERERLGAGFVLVGLPHELLIGVHVPVVVLACSPPDRCRFQPVNTRAAA